MSSPKLPNLRAFGDNVAAWARQVIYLLNEHFQTHLAVHRAHDITISGATIATTITDSDAVTSAIILVMPTNTAAKALHWYVDPSTVSNGATWILNHDTASVTATFRYAILN